MRKSRQAPNRNRIVYLGRIPVFTPIFASSNNVYKYSYQRKELHLSAMHMLIDRYLWKAYATSILIRAQPTLDQVTV